MDNVAVFLDRDGTVCEHVPYLSAPERFELRPTVPAGGRLLESLPVKLLVTTNQSGVGRGYFSRADMERVNDEMVRSLASEGVTVDDIYVCPHAPSDDCQCRKPEPGMLEAAASDHGVDLAASFMVGDRRSDVRAGRRAGCTTILFPSTETQADPTAIDADHVVETFREAAEIIQSRVD